MRLILHPEGIEKRGMRQQKSTLCSKKIVGHETKGKNIVQINILLYNLHMQIWFIGRTLASQAGKVGSTPIICFFYNMGYRKLKRTCPLCYVFVDM